VLAARRQGQSVSAGANAARTGASDVLALGFGTATGMWALGYACRLPPAVVPSWLLLALLLVCLLAGGFVAGRCTRRGWRGGLYATLLAATLNLLILGSLLGGDQPNRVVPAALWWIPGSFCVAAVLGAATVRFVDAQSKESAEREVVLLLDPPTGLGSARWDDATPISLSVNDLETEPEAEAAFGDVPPSANSASELAALGKALGDWLYRTQTLELPANPALDLSAAPGEERHAFQRRCEDAARARRDDELARARERYEKERDRLDEKLARAERELRQAQAAVEERKRATWVNIGESVIATILGRRSTRMVSGALSKQRMVSEAQKKIEDLQQAIADLKEQIQKVEEEFQAVAQQITDRWATASQQIETRKLSPRRNDVQVTLCALAWEPFWEFQYVDAQGLTRQWRVSAWARQERSAR